MCQIIFQEYASTIVEARYILKRDIMSDESDNEIALPVVIAQDCKNLYFVVMDYITYETSRENLRVCETYNLPGCL